MLAGMQPAKARHLRPWQLLPDALAYDGGDFGVRALQSDLVFLHLLQAQLLLLEDLVENLSGGLCSYAHRLLGELAAP